MPISVTDEPTGSVVQFPDGTTPDVIKQRMGQFRQTHGAGPPKPQEESGWAALWHGALHGAGDILTGAKQLGVEMGGAEAGSMGQEFPTQELRDKIQKQEAARETSYQASPGVQQHPVLSGVGRVGGNVAATSPLAILPAGAATTAGRVGMGALGGALSGAMQPAKDVAERLWSAAIGSGAGVVGAGVGELAATPLVKALVGNSPQEVTSTFRKIIKPTISGRGTWTRQAVADQRVLGAVDDIIASKDVIPLTNPNTGLREPGKIPSSIAQFSEAIDGLKKHLYSEYDTLAKQAAGAGAPRIDLAPSVKMLKDYAENIGTKAFSPQSGREALAYAQTLENMGTVTATEAQELIGKLNEKLQPFYKASTDQKAHELGVMLGPVASRIRQDLDTAITNTTGGQYQALKIRYGRLTDIERDVANAYAREARAVPGGLVGRWAQFLQNSKAVMALIRMDPSALIEAVGIKAARKTMEHLNSPNRAIGKMFELRAQSKATPSPGPIPQMLGKAIRPLAPGVGGVGLGSLGSTTTRSDPRESVIGQ